MVSDDFSGVGIGMVDSGSTLRGCVTKEVQPRRKRSEFECSRLDEFSSAILSTNVRSAIL